MGEKWLWELHYKVSHGIAGGGATYTHLLVFGERRLCQGDPNNDRVPTLRAFHRCALELAIG